MLRLRGFLGKAPIPWSLRASQNIVSNQHNLIQAPSDAPTSRRAQSTNVTPSARPSPIIEVFPEKKKEWNTKMAVAGGVGLVGGLGAFALQHLSMPTAVDALASMSVLAGGAAVAAAFPRSDGGDPGDRHVISMRGYLNQSGKVPRFSFTLLNGRSTNMNKKMDDVAMGSRELPSALEQTLRRADETAEERRKKEVETRISEMEALATDLLDSGADPVEVKHRCFPRCYVVTFEDPPQGPKSRRGPPQTQTTASAVAQFSGLVSLLVDVATEHDEVILKLTSPGGSVSEYGQLAMQVLRLRKAGITTTVCVDTVAASGGYMAACVADKVYASPFAFVGSIGVIAEMPNLSKLLRKNDVDWMVFTAGKYKRTVHPFSEISDEGKEKFQEQLDDIHDAFRDHVSSHRGSADADDVGTGEAWLAAQALQKGLVDELLTSDEYVQSKLTDSIVIEVKEVAPQPSIRDLLERSVAAGESLFTTVIGMLRPDRAAAMITPYSLRSTTSDKFRA